MSSFDPPGGLEPPLDPRFTFDFVAYDEPGDPNQRWTTWHSVEPLCRGPEPRPDWVVTSQGALDTELGVLKTGKEAEVFLLHRGEPDAEGVVMAAKRYRGAEHSDFHRSASYTEGRRTRRSRDGRAIAKKTEYGRAIAAGQWAAAEWEALKSLWLAGVPVPYPVQIDGTEILLELITDTDGDPAPRLAQTRPGPALLADYFDQLRNAMVALTMAGWAHGDLSPYNILATGQRVVIIDLPQVIDLAANPAGLDFLQRDCANVCRWFVARGHEVDEQALFADLLGYAL
ncbi:MAG: RIO1 family regulatory kinase/ATPase [Nocardioides sp.]